MKNKGILILSLILICVIFAAVILNQSHYTAKEYAFDTMISISAKGKNAKNAVEESIKLIRDLENELSIHKETSYVSKLNSDKKITPTKSIADIIDISLFASEISNGSFDITVKPLSDLWNINGGGPVPSDADIQIE